MGGLFLGVGFFFVFIPKRCLSLSARRLRRSKERSMTSTQYRPEEGVSRVDMLSAFFQDQAEPVATKLFHTQTGTLSQAFPRQFSGAGQPIEEFVEYEGYGEFQFPDPAGVERALWLIDQNARAMVGVMMEQPEHVPESSLSTEQGSFQRFYNEKKNQVYRFHREELGELFQEEAKSWLPAWMELLQNDNTPSLVAWKNQALVETTAWAELFVSPILYSYLAQLRETYQQAREAEETEEVRGREQFLKNHLHLNQVLESWHNLSVADWKCGGVLVQAARAFLPVLKGLGEDPRHLDPEALALPLSRK